MEFGLRLGPTHADIRPDELTMDLTEQPCGVLRPISSTLTQQPCGQNRGDNLARVALVQFTPVRYAMEAAQERPSRHPLRLLPS